MNGGAVTYHIWRCPVCKRQCEPNTRQARLARREREVRDREQKVFAMEEELRIRSKGSI